MIDDVRTITAADLRAAWPPSRPEHWIEPEGVDGLVSVIIPVYNRADLIRETLDSVREQEYRPLEVIVVDDGSTDGTADSVRAWTAEMNLGDGLSVRCIEQPNRGVSSARNRGALASSGQYLQFLDSDDKLHSKKIASQVDLLRDRKKAGYVYCLTTLFGPEGGRKGQYGYDMTEFDLKEMIRKCPYQTSAALYRRSTCQMAGPWPENVSIGGDWEFAIRAYLASRGEISFQPKHYNLQRSGSQERLTADQKTFDEGRLQAIIQNRKVLAETDLLQNKDLRREISKNFTKMAFRLHDHDAPKSKILRALYEGMSGGTLEMKIAIGGLAYMYRASDLWYSAAKKAIRRIG